MDQVRQAYGAPARDMGAVGSPAISRWVYDGYTVYFERSRVVHVVRTQPLPRGAAAPAPVVATPPAAEAPVYVEPAYVEPAAVAETPAAMPAEPVVEPDMAPAAEEPALQDTAMDEPSMSAGEPVEQPAVAAPAAEPIPAPALAPVSPGGGFRFDPVTGRLIIDSEATQGAEAPAQAAPATVTPEPAAEPVPAEPQPAASEPAPADNGNATDDNLEFDPETGTFRPKR